MAKLWRRSSHVLCVHTGNGYGVINWLDVHMALTLFSIQGLERELAEQTGGKIIIKSAFLRELSCWVGKPVIHCKQTVNFIFSIMKLRTTHPIIKQVFPERKYEFRLRWYGESPTLNINDSGSHQEATPHINGAGSCWFPYRWYGESVTPRIVDTGSRLLNFVQETLRLNDTLSCRRWFLVDSKSSLILERHSVAKTKLWIYFTIPKGVIKDLKKG